MAGDGDDVSDVHPERPNKLMKLSSYLLALRPWSLSASLMPTLLGSAIAHKSTGDFNPVLLVVTAFTVLSVHGAGNVVNTYFDYIKGIDSKKQSDDRTLVDQLLSKDEVVTLGAMLYMLGCVGFIMLAMLSPAKMEHLALIYFGGLSSSFLYTGGIGLKYIALGDVLILVIFGPLSVLFAFMAQTGKVAWASMYYAIPLALNTEAILHSNNARDRQSDAKAGIVTLAILVGHTASHVLYAAFLFGPYIIFVVNAMHHSVWLLLPLITLPSAFQLEKEFRSDSMQRVPRKTARLNLFFGLLYVVAIYMSDSNRLPYIH
ncbi:ubiA prenyltransferase domain-containing protein 1 homolog [Neocloeon triangulifer]|uniref:ubiA prenyltransferase domain-containing protein 1 homolog n=1 Tax=Neocloeon triangulifer TaxID=2078957 RepID=UPI00286F3058|nr:ubiA prenyltransferase domain-containing protein 1 homolog [Neocloeon triangulifer]XP_059477168.1 ubiA prenyltransferase domain-containing protein 1 homolog [Neocloeon triangulifer]XP_059477169.1 ubiA prenyltransferase domain-containing protein 1 homolog [Neocloeon triangulifer]